MKRNICTYLLALNFFLTTFIYAEGKPTLNYQMDYKVANWSNGASYKRVIFKPENFPKHIPLVFESQDLNQKILQHWNVFIDDQNRLIERETKKEVELRLGVYAKGEPIQCTLRTGLLYANNKQLLDSIYIVPRPIQAKDEAGHLLSLRLISPNGEMFHMTATGFEPFETVEICSSSEAEAMQHPTQASPEGRIEASFCPAVIGKLSGKASIEIKGKNTKDLKVNYRWGKGAFK